MAVMQAADLDGNGAIDYEEFIVSTVNLARLNKKASASLGQTVAITAAWHDAASCDAIRPRCLALLAGS